MMTRLTFRRLIGTGLFILGLTGCANTPPEFCSADSWHDRGFSHALSGQTDQSNQADNDCARKDAPLAYRVGFDNGLEKYCTFKRGLLAGEMGQGPAQSCATPEWDAYQTGFVTGHRIFEVNARLEAIAKELEAARKVLWELEAAGHDARSPKVRSKIARVEQLEQEREAASAYLLDLRANVQHD